jgi:hypothetical protein
MSMSLTPIIIFVFGWLIALAAGDAIEDRDAIENRRTPRKRLHLWWYFLAWGLLFAGVWVFERL